MRLTARILGLTGCCALLAGCPDGGEPSGGAPSDPAKFCEWLASAMAEEQLECKAIAPEAAAYDKASDLLECEKGIGASMKAGRVKLDAGQATKCIEAVRALPCDGEQDDATIPACEAAVVGTVATGGNCLRRDDCVVKTDYCKEPSDVCGLGTCTAAPKLNETCEDDCYTDGLFCEYETKRCVASGKVGDTCGTSTSPSCEWGLYCQKPDSSQPGTCQEAKASGTCTWDGECVGFCQKATGQQTGNCAAYPEPRQLGEVCDETSHFRCVEGAYCDGICKLDSKLGEPCGDYTEYWRSCLEGYCKREQGAKTGACQPYPKIGEPCGLAPGCGEGYCHPDTKLCVACAQ